MTAASAAAPTPTSSKCPRRWAPSGRSGHGRRSRRSWPLWSRKWRAPLSTARRRAAFEEEEEEEEQKEDDRSNAIMDNFKKENSIFILFPYSISFKLSIDVWPISLKHHSFYNNAICQPIFFCPPFYQTRIKMILKNDPLIPVN
jgi:hypothetical protein